MISDILFAVWLIASPTLFALIGYRYGKTAGIAKVMRLDTKQFMAIKEVIRMDNTNENQ